MIVVNFVKVDSRAETPRHGSSQAAGYDIAVVLDECPDYAWTEEYETLAPYETRMFRTGLAIELPPGYFGDLTGRSSLYKKGLSVKRGVIDSDFRGEMKVVVRNDSSHWVRIYNGEYLAQLIVKKHETIQWNEVTKLHETERNEGGFGSTDGKEITI